MRRVRVWGASAEDVGVPPTVGGMRDPQDDGEPVRDEPVDNAPCQYCGSFIVPWNMPGECDACLAYEGDDTFDGTMDEWLAAQEAKDKSSGEPWGSL